MQRSLLAFALSLLAFACNDAALQTPEETETDPIVASTGGEELCIAGYETCPCAEGGVCLDGLQCLSDLCVEMAVAESSTDDGTTEGSGTTSAIQEESSSSSGVLSTESGSSSTSGEESSSSTGPTTECFEGDTFCQLGSGLHLTCVDDEWIADSCEDSCLVTGHTGENCADNQQECVCDGFSDYDCEIAMEVTCYCYFEDLLGESCSNDEREQFYQWCFQDTDPVIACFGSYYTDAGLDCDGAIANCL